MVTQSSWVSGMSRCALSGGWKGVFSVGPSKDLGDP